MFDGSTGLFRRSIAALTAAAILVTTYTLPAQAQGRSLKFIRDSEIEQVLRNFATPMLVSGDLVPEAVRILLIEDNQLNAFVSGGQNMFWFTGLLMDTDLDELMGVMAHEIGHIAGGHLARGNDAAEDASTIAVLGALAGLAAAIGSGRPDVGLGVLGGGQEAARRTFLAFSRTQEGAADEFAMRVLEENGWPATGLVKMMERFIDQTLLPQTKQVEYLLSHPLSTNRLIAARDFVQTRSKHANSRFPAEFQEQHARMKAKLFGFIRPDQALRLYPETATEVAPRYGRAIALYRKGQIADAIKLIDALIAKEPKNPYFHELKGQILFENARIAEAIAPFREAVRLLPESGLIQAAAGHAMLEAQDDRLLPEAIQLLTEATRLEPRSAFPWRLLAGAYSRADMQPQLAYARAEEALARGDIRTAKFHADKAERMLPAGSPEWIRAQDIRILMDQVPTRRGG